MATSKKSPKTLSQLIDELDLIKNQIASLQASFEELENSETQQNKRKQKNKRGRSS